MQTIFSQTPAASLKAGGSEPLAAAAACLEEALDHQRLEGLADADLQRLMAALIRISGAKSQMEEGWAPLAIDDPAALPTATEVMATVSQILRAVDLQVFELGMWQSWTGR